jgi:hypothetical protein
MAICLSCSGPRLIDKQPERRKGQCQSSRRDKIAVLEWAEESNGVALVAKRSSHRLVPERASFFLPVVSWRRQHEISKLVPSRQWLFADARADGFRVGSGRHQDRVAVFIHCQQVNCCFSQSRLAIVADGKWNQGPTRTRHCSWRSHGIHLVSYFMSEVPRLGHATLLWRCTSQCQHSAAIR